jgi:hypothetical protein
MLARRAAGHAAAQRAAAAWVVAVMLATLALVYTHQVRAGVLRGAAAPRLLVSWQRERRTKEVRAQPAVTCADAPKHAVCRGAALTQSSATHIPPDWRGYA